MIQDRAVTGGWGRGRRRWVAGALLPRRRCTGDANLGLSGADSNGGWVGRHLRDMRNPPEATEWWIGAGLDLGKARGGAGPWGSPANERARSSGLRLGPGSIWVQAQIQIKARARRCSSVGGSPRRGCSASGGGTPACSAQGSGVGYEPRYLAQTREGIGVLTGGSERAVQPCSGVGDEVRRRRVRRIPWSGRGGAAPGVLIPRTGARSGYGGEHGVRGARASPGASYCSEAASPAAAGGSASSSGVAAAAARVLGAARVDERGAGVKGCYL